MQGEKSHILWSLKEILGHTCTREKIFVCMWVFQYSKNLQKYEGQLHFQRVIHSSNCLRFCLFMHVIVCVYVRACMCACACFVCVFLFILAIFCNKDLFLLYVRSMQVHVM